MLFTIIPRSFTCFRRSGPPVFQSYFAENLPTGSRYKRCLYQNRFRRILPENTGNNNLSFYPQHRYIPDITGRTAVKVERAIFAAFSQNPSERYLPMPRSPIYALAVGNRSTSAYLLCSSLAMHCNALLQQCHRFFLFHIRGLQFCFARQMPANIAFKFVVAIFLVLLPHIIENLKNN